MTFSQLTDRERLVAEQAVETLRALDKAAVAAPFGQGLACMEACIHEKGFDLLRSIMASTASAQTEAQKKGSVSGSVPAGKSPNSKVVNPARF